MIPSDIKYDGNATPPQFTDNADQVIEKGTHIRLKVVGIRGEVSQMFAIATIREVCGLAATLACVFAKERSNRTSLGEKYENKLRSQLTRLPCRPLA